MSERSISDIIINTNPYVVFESVIYMDKVKCEKI